VVPATLAVAAALVVEWAITGDVDVLARSALGLLIARTGSWLLWFFGGGLGSGDVRLAALVGLVTARLGWQSFVVGSTARCCWHWSTCSRGRDDSPLSAASGHPTGPFLLAGAWVGLLVESGS
jgi:leader peptidase (prepilin peptidase)/N-methyltransferase